MKKELNIFVNDFSLDLKLDFEDMLGIGMNINQIENQLLQSVSKLDDDQQCVYWTTIAYLEWKYGVLQEKTKEMTIKVIEEFMDYKLFRSHKEQKERIMTLNSFKKLF